MVVTQDEAGTGAKATPPGDALADAGGLEPDEPTSALAAFESRRFLLFWSTISLSLTGLWVRITAQGYLVYDLTDDEFLLGLVAFANAAPVLLAAPVAGAVLDRIDRRRVLLIVQLTLVVSGFALAVLVQTGVIQVWQIMLIAIVNGVASGFDWPARLTLMPALVERRQLKSAVALTAAAFNGSRIIGPAIGGYLIGLVGLAACFYFNAAMYVPFVIVLATLSIDRVVVPPDQVAGVRGAFGNLLDGYKYIWRTPTIRGLLSVDIVPLMFGIAYFTLAPAVARDVLGLGGRGLGLLLAANGIGALAGTIGVAMLSGVRQRGRIVIMGVGCFAVLLVCYALSSNMILSLVLILMLGLATSTYATFNDTLVQTLVDENYRGRVLAVYTMLWGLTPIGGLEAGFLARFIGVQGALVVNGLIVLAYVPVLLRYTPVRRID
ncbi:MAG TPA: MFS transporter [Thermomicrobiales bacterium]|nr:MFS transporter [Thermomicrobiales bacterium]